MNKTVKPIDGHDPVAKSASIVAQNIEKLKELFPDAVSEGKVDLTVVKEHIGESLLPEEEREEKYGINWFGKRKARQIALTPSTGTLRPCPEESVDWNTTKNIMIEGDNLEVLKLLQKSYAGKVKLIYIDPPYNTGKDFVYPDNFQDNIKNYLELTGQIEGGAKMQANTESSGRYHTDWLNMMYPRLKLARNLLSEDGVIFISIDDTEISSLKNICDELFGEENFVANTIWQSRTSISDDHEISPNHNHTLIYSKYRQSLEFYGLPLDESDYANPDSDPRGKWKLVPIDANKPGGNTKYGIINPKTGIEYYPPAGRSWAINPDEFARLMKDGRIKFGINDESSPKRKLYWNERQSRGDTKTPSSIILDAGTTKDGTNEVAVIFEAKKVFDYPKPVSFLERLLTYGCSRNRDNLILDFFAGSATTAHAVFNMNLSDKISRRFIMIQLPEPCPDNSIAFKMGYTNIAEISKERLRRAGKKIKENNPNYSGDTGFRVFKLDTSNIRPWEPDWDNLDEMVKHSVNHIKDGRSEADILYELLLKLGLDLSIPIEEKKIGNKKVQAIGAGTLLVCLDKSISRADAEPLALGIVEWHKQLCPVGETTCVFLDSAFADDVAKSNLSAILQQHGLENVRSL